MDNLVLEELDSPLKQENDITAVYKEISKTLSRDYLDFEAVRPQSVRSHFLNTVGIISA